MRVHSIYPLEAAVDIFIKLPPAERQTYFQETAARLGVSAAIVEKDFWVCWTLQELFALPGVGSHLIFKGGTSLSKVYRLIDRFSEDIDVSIARDFLGFGGDQSPEAATGGKERQRRLERLMDAAKMKIAHELRPSLTRAFEAKLRGGEPWSLDLDPDDSQSLLFRYPRTTVSRVGEAYVQPNVKIELGARSDDWPREIRAVTPYVAEQFPAAFTIPSCEVAVLEAERTFWEKATLLHSYCHCPLDKLIPPRLSRHYYDLALLIDHGIGIKAAARLDLLDRVVAHKTVFFRSGWANYERAKPGSLRLTPPNERREEWQKDYGRMSEMLFHEPPPFEEVLATITKFEHAFNRARPTLPEAQG